jgi:hypothetical protein
MRGNYFVIQQIADFVSTATFSTPASPVRNQSEHEMCILAIERATDGVPQTSPRMTSAPSSPSSTRPTRMLSPFSDSAPTSEVERLPDSP